MGWGRLGVIIESNLNRVRLSCCWVGVGLGCDNNSVTQSHHSSQHFLSFKYTQIFSRNIFLPLFYLDYVVPTINLALFITECQFFDNNSLISFPHYCFTCQNISPWTLGSHFKYIFQNTIYNFCISLGRAQYQIPKS